MWPWKNILLVWKKLLHRHDRHLDLHQPGGEGIRGRSDGGQKASEACSASWLSSHWGHCGQHHYYDRHWYYHQHQHVKLFCLTITLISRWAFLWLHFSNFQSKYSFLRCLFGLWSNSALQCSSCLFGFPQLTNTNLIKVVLWLVESKMDGFNHK